MMSTQVLFQGGGEDSLSSPGFIVYQAVTLACPSPSHFPGALTLDAGAFRPQSHEILHHAFYSLIGPHLSKTPTNRKTAGTVTIFHILCRSISDVTLEDNIPNPVVLICVCFCMGKGSRREKVNLIEEDHSNAGLVHSSIEWRVEVGERWEWEGEGAVFLFNIKCT